MIAEKLARLGHRVWIVGRNGDEAKKVVKKIIRKTGNQAVFYELVDFSLQSHIESFATTWQRPLHVLLNNHPIAPFEREETMEGHELSFATNVLSYYWLTMALLPRLKEAAQNSHDVPINWAGELDLNDLEFQRRRFDQHTAYRQSKQANRMLAAALAPALSSSGILINSCHSGDVNSKLSNDLGFGGSESPESGAATPVWVATKATTSGMYFEDEKESKCRFFQVKVALQQLLPISAASERP